MNRPSDESRFNAARDVLDRVSMADILTGLGAKLPRRGNRIKKCLICNSESDAFSFNESRKVWHCFACGEGGGMVSLVSRVYNCKPQEALKWIAGLAGFELERWNKWQARQHAAAMEAAGIRARGLVEWRDQVIDELRERRDILQLIYWWAIRIGATEHEAGLWQRIQSYDERIQFHREAPWAWLADIYEHAMQRTEVA